MTPKSIKSFRKKTGLSIEELAGLVNVSHMTIRRWEAGTTKPYRLYRDRLNKVISEYSGSKNEISGKDIEAFRKKHGLSVAELASKVGVSRMTEYQWEKGETKPSRLLKERLEKVMVRYSRK